MKNAFSLTLLSVFITSLSCSSCRPDGGIQIGGKGGKAVLNVTPQHHGRNIDSCKVYIKYNTLDKPGSYDDSAWCKKVGNKPVATFEGLKKGNYYLYGRGWDPEGDYEVDGGVGYKLKDENAQSYNLAVSEEK